MKVSIEHPSTSKITCIAISPNGKILASGTVTSDIHLWELPSGKELGTLNRKKDKNGHSYWISSLTFTPDGLTLISGSGDAAIVFWDLTRETKIRTLYGHSNSVNCLEVSHNGRLLASGSYDKLIKLWWLPTHTLLADLAGHSNKVCYLSFSPDDKLLASGSSDCTTRLWKLSALNTRHLYSINRCKEAIANLAFSSDGKHLACSGWNGTIYLWSLEDNRFITTTRGGKLDPWSSSTILATSDNLLALGTHDDGSIELWEILENKSLGTIKIKDDSQDCGRLMLSVADKVCVTYKVDKYSFVQEGSIELWAAPRPISVPRK